VSSAHAGTMEQIDVLYSMQFLYLQAVVELRPQTSVGQLVRLKKEQIGMVQGAAVTGGVVVRGAVVVLIVVGAVVVVSGARVVVTFAAAVVVVMIGAQTGPLAVVLLTLQPGTSRHTAGFTEAHCRNVHEPLTVEFTWQRFQGQVVADRALQLDGPHTEAPCTSWQPESTQFVPLFGMAMQGLRPHTAPSMAHAGIRLQMAALYSRHVL